MAGTVRLGRYGPPLSRWVPSIKSRCWRDMGVLLGRELGLQANEAIQAALVRRPDVVVSVPVHWSRRMLRGIDHGAVLADEVARAMGIPRVVALRAGLASRQTGGTKEQRSGNRGRFEAVRGAAVSKGCCVLLVDDVRTTGSTLREAMAALAPLGVESVVLGVCAVTDPPRRSSVAEARLNCG